MSGRFSRRTALRILAASAALPAGVVGLRALAPALAAETWHGESMGSPASVSLWHQDASRARRTLLHVVAEVQRLERIFSLHLPDSEICRLNRAGRLERASGDLATVLDAALDMARRSDGAFDPTVQSLWLLHETLGDLGRLERDSVPFIAQYAQGHVGCGEIVISGRRIVLGTARELTLNAIAQGYITDRVTDLLRNEGFDHAMVEVGESRALGAQVDGRPFVVGIRSPSAPDAVDRSIGLADAALSVSGGYGYRFADGADHIFEPRSGLSPRHLLDAAVVAPRAIDADALSTAIYVAGEDAAPSLLAGTKGAHALLTRADGTRVEIPAQA